MGRVRPRGNKVGDENKASGKVAAKQCGILAAGPHSDMVLTSVHCSHKEKEKKNRL